VPTIGEFVAFSLLRQLHDVRQQRLDPECHQGKLAASGLQSDSRHVPPHCLHQAERRCLRLNRRRQRNVQYSERHPSTADELRPSVSSVRTSRARNPRPEIASGKSSNSA
jgi:hypothetical protein